MNTPFRNWVRLMWEEHKSEVESYEGKKSRLRSFCIFWEV